MTRAPSSLVRVFHNVAISALGVVLASACGQEDRSPSPLCRHLTTLTQVAGNARTDLLDHARMVPNLMAITESERFGHVIDADETFVLADPFIHLTNESGTAVLYALARSRAECEQAVELGSVSSSLAIEIVAGRPNAASAGEHARKAAARYADIAQQDADFCSEIGFPQMAQDYQNHALPEIERWVTDHAELDEALLTACESTDQR